MMKKLYAAAVVASLALAGAGQAQAAASACSDAQFKPDVTDNVTPNIGCQIDPNITNDSGSGDFNDGNWFGFNDWTFDAKDNNLNGVDEGDNTLGFSVDGDLRSGTWSFSGDLGGYDVMLVFKDGNVAEPNALVSYRVNATNGDYTTPFYNDELGQDPKDISHISVWKRMGGNGEVPVPATLILLGVGLVGLGYRLRKS